MRRGLGLGLATLAVLAGGLVVWMLQTRPVADDAAAPPPPADSQARAEALPVFADSTVESRPIEVSEVAPAAAAPAAAVRPDAPAGAALRVTVLDPDLAPLPGATVWLKTAPLRLLRTGPDGVAVVTGEFGAEVDVAARHPDFRFGLAHATLPASGEPPGEATITLTAELTACLRIEDVRGGAIEGAAVSFQEYRAEDILMRSSLVATPDELTVALSRELFEGVFDETRLTGPDGRACVAGITAGRIRVDVRAPGYVWAAHREFEVGPRGGNIGVIQLTPARILRGTVVDAQGAVPEAVVEVMAGRRDTGGFIRVVTDAAGAFALDSLPPDITKIPLLVTHASRGDFFEERFVVPPDDVTITLRPSFDLTLLPRDAATKLAVAGPLTVTRLVPFRAFSIRSGQPKKAGVVDGSAHVGWVPYYATALQVEAPGYARIELDIATIEAAGGAPLAVDLVGSGTIAIHALDRSSGLPVRGAKVTASRSELSSTKGRPNRSNWLAEAPWDEAAGAYILDTSLFTFAVGVDESFALFAPNYENSEIITVSANGVRLCGPSVDLTMQPK